MTPLRQTCNLITIAYLETIAGQLTYAPEEIATVRAIGIMQKRAVEGAASAARAAARVVRAKAAVSSEVKS